METSDCETGNNTSDYVTRIQTPNVNDIYVGEDAQQGSLYEIMQVLNTFEMGDDPSGPSRGFLIPAKIIEVKSCTELVAIIYTQAGFVTSRVLMTNIVKFGGEETQRYLDTIREQLDSKFVFLEYRIYVPGQIPKVDVYIPVIPPPVSECSMSGEAIHKKINLENLANYAVNLFDSEQWNSYFEKNQEALHIEDGHVINFNQLLLGSFPNLSFSAGNFRKQRYNNDGFEPVSKRGRGGFARRGGYGRHNSYYHTPVSNTSTMKTYVPKSGTDWSLLDTCDA